MWLLFDSENMKILFFFREIGKFYTSRPPGDKRVRFVRRSVNSDFGPRLEVRESAKIVRVLRKVFYSYYCIMQLKKLHLMKKKNDFKLYYLGK